MPDSFGPGFVVMAVYRPNDVLFRRQVASLKAQTVTDWVCLIGIDGRDPVATALAKELTAGDPRFELVEYDENIGVYRHFERLLDRVPSDAEWVSLADQDDYWYPDKFRRVLSVLRCKGVSAVSGQARLVDIDGQTAGLTDRRPVSAAQMLIRNQVSGALTVFRRDVLTLAQPFPASTDTAMHDHWLGLCAAQVGRVVVLKDPVQDYIQHDGNVLGERTSSVAHKLMRDRDSSESLRVRLASASRDRWGWRVSMARELNHRSTSAQPGLRAVARGRLSPVLAYMLLESVLAKRIRVGEGLAMGAAAAAYRWCEGADHAPEAVPTPG